MPAYVIGNFVLYCVINASTPGLGNILELNTVTNYGWKKGKPLCFGIFTGYYVVQLICAVFVFGIGAFLPSVLGVMKYIGAAYILWLAIHIAISKPQNDDDNRSASYMKGFLLQFINVKIYLFDMTALTGYVTDYHISLTALVITELFIATLGSFATLTWIGMGALIQKYYLKHYQIIYILLALTLVKCIIIILK